MKIRDFLIRFGSAAATGLLLGPTGCQTADQGDHDDHAQLGETAQPVFLNGNFEDGTAGQVPQNWTLTTYLNPGVTVSTPQTRPNLNLSPGGAAATVKLTSATGPETQPDFLLGASASLRWPKYGNGAAIVNQNLTNNNTNSLKQTMTIAAGDIDANDGLAHVRFTVAPVLENGGHTAAQQPYYFVQLTNITKGNAVLYRDYNASAQPGVPWKNIGINYYTDWQLVDIAPGSAQLAIGDQIELEVIAAGCSQGGHRGHLYVDGVGASIPGLFVSATGPAAANQGANITYTLTYHNDGTGTALVPNVSFTTPPSTTYQSISSGLATCTTPMPNGTGAVSCVLPDLAPGQSGTITITVKIDGAATGTITAGNYQISATGVSPLLGPKVYTSVTQNLVYADLGITKTNGVGGVAWGSPVSYTIVASNAGPNTATNAVVTDTLPAQLTGATWTCAGASGGTCAAPSGNGSINQQVTLPTGGTATFTVNANVVAGSGTGSLSNTASIAVPVGITEANAVNNSANDTDPIGELKSVTVTKGGSGGGTVTSAPAAISCGSTCTGNFLSGSNVVLTATPDASSIFMGWSGGCSGTGQCSLTVNAATSVTATFAKTNGGVCSTAADCGSGNCIDGVCCNTTCGGGAANDCQACNVSGSVGTCAPAPTTTVCRASAGTCDAAETCNGVTTVCPADLYAPALTSCRPSAGACDAAEVCTGLSPSCPADAFVSALTVCRVSAGVCDTAESCTGSSAACPADGFAPSSTQCRAAAGACDVAESCTGSAAACPADSLAPAATVCRAANGACDVAESCNGVTTACPADGFAAAATTCRPKNGLCDVAETCSGSAANCPADGFEPASTVCRNAAGDCDVAESCTGAGGTCPVDAHEAPGTVCRAANGICDVAEACDGGVACPANAFAAAGTECSGASCEDGSETQAAACTGAAAGCPAPVVEACDAYICGATACLEGCLSSSDCASGFYCELADSSTGTCQPKKDLGGECDNDGQCGSAACVDGFCCNQACDGQCEACDVTGQEGTCSAVTGAPHGDRTECASDGSLCGGECNGADTDACTYPDNGVECRAASCANGTATLAAGCNGAGACPDEQTQDCGNFVCGADACLGNCTTDDDCDDGNYCSAGVCVPKLPNGGECEGNNQCNSAICADGFCCNVACEGQCQACDVDGTEGTCSPVLGDPHGGRAPCASDGSVCGGQCDGNDETACAFPAADIECRAGACADGVATLPASCDGSGACPDEQQQTCSPFLCGATACDGDCTIDSDCAAGNYCSAGVCVEKHEPGDLCSGNNECASDFCVDGVCCNVACEGQCQACDVNGSVGTCSPVDGAPHGARDACATDGSECGGTCNGIDTDACAFPGGAVTCREPACEGGVATLEAFCDGAGACPAVQQQECGEFVCGATACAGDCDDDTDCSAGNFCSGGACQPKRAAGETCGGDNECTSAFCTDGVCCNVACEGQCQACDVEGSVGECVAVSGEPHGRRTACSGQGACAGSCNGTDTEACAFPGTDTVCSEGSCADGVATLASTCNGNGACEQAQTETCDPYVCSSEGACADSCTTAADCMAGFTCDDGACVEVKGGANGQDDDFGGLAAAGGGCSCRTAGDDTSNDGLWLASALAMVMVARRQRRQRATVRTTRH